MEDDAELLLEQNAEEEDPVEEVFRNLIDLETEFLFFRFTRGLDRLKKIVLRIGGGPWGGPLDS